MRSFAFFAIFTGTLLAQSQPPPMLQAPLGPDSVVATVDGVDVTVADIRKMLETAPPQVTAAMKQGPQVFVQQMFLFHHLSAEGDKLKLAEQSPLKEQLEMQRAWVVANAMVNHERDGYSPTAEEIENFYNRNKSRWEQSKIKIIFIAFKPTTPNAKPEEIADAARQAFNAVHSPSERSEEEARKLASDLVKQLRDGADFVKLVEKYSDDSSSKGSAGDFGVPILATSAYSDDFKKPILALKPGEISEPIRQPNGFYIVRLEERSTQSLNEVREPIIQELRQSHLNEWLTQLNARYQPTIKSSEFFLQPEKYLTPAAPPPLPPTTH